MKAGSFPEDITILVCCMTIMLQFKVAFVVKPIKQFIFIFVVYKSEYYDNDYGNKENKSQSGLKYVKYKV